jgi:hypothetical protein
MEQKTQVLNLDIEGYTKEQVLFTAEELQKGATSVTIQILLYRKFGLYELPYYLFIEQIT